MDEIEIPEAIRENTNAEPPEKSRFVTSPLIIGILCLGIAGFSAIFLFKYVDRFAERESLIPQPTSQPKVEPKVKTAPSDTPKPPSAEVAAPSEPVTKPNNALLGHLPYNVAPESELTAVNGDESVRMRPSAATKLEQMLAAARAEGINLIPLSAFRDTQAQGKLFFEVKEQRSQNATQRAEVSAPPGYSEHHTGYAIDLGDGDALDTHLEVEFAETAAFRWLQQNALKYSFELSFPPNNKQGVSYEPWHWRFVGDRDSLETFYKVRN